MPTWGPISRRRLVKALRDLGFDGPFSGGRLKVAIVTQNLRTQNASRASTQQRILQTEML